MVFHLRKELFRSIGGVIIQRLIHGYDFDALYDDGKAPDKHKKIMVNFMEDNVDLEIYSNELKKQAGVERLCRP